MTSALKIPAKTCTSNDHGGPPHSPHQLFNRPRNFSPPVAHLIQLLGEPPYLLPTMSYKKDEDAGDAIIKVDRTAVYQEGMPTSSNTRYSMRGIC
jgi:hypothetical protein